jgi:ribosome-associated protein
MRSAGKEKKTMEENRIPAGEESAPALPPDASPEAIARYAVSVLDKRKARDLRLLHTEAQTILADYFVIASGTSRTQLRAMGDEVEYRLGLCGIRPLHTEGDGSGGWLLIDFGSVIVHIFSREAREFYNLEKLYGETSEVDISALLSED